MNVIDIHIKNEKMGNFLALFPLGDEHFESEVHRKSSMQYIKDSIKEVREMFKVPLGFIKLGDELEYDRQSFSEKLQAVGKPSDRKGHETMAKNLVKRLVYNYDGMFKKGDLKMAAVSGNHKVNFTIGHKEIADMRSGVVPHLNSSHMLAEMLGFPYMGDGHCKINIHLHRGESRKVYKILILHGEGAGSSAKADITEFQRIRAMYGELDLIIKAHSHKPMTMHMGRFDTDFTSRDKEVEVEETTIINVGSCRGSMAIGHTDYGEKKQYTPIPTRFPFIILKSHTTHRRGSVWIKAIPITF